MASTITITIGSPVLTGGDKFIVKYRLIGSPTWITVSPNPDNSPFNITGLADGDYEYSASIVSLPNDPVVYNCFTIQSACDCPVFSEQQFISSGGLNIFSFKIDASISGSPAVGGWPPCGLRIQLTDPLGVVEVVDIPTPAYLSTDSPAISGIYYFSKALTGTSYTINIYKNCCTGDNDIENVSLCTTFDMQINSGGNPDTCLNAIFRQSAITASYDSATGNYYLYVFAKFPTPCDTMTANYLEGFVVSGAFDSGSASITGINALPSDPFGYKMLRMQVHPNPTDTKLQYHLNIVDCCGTVHYLS